MSTPIENYRKMVEQPWGKIFYDVTALEPNEEMYKLRFESDDYNLITQGLEYLKPGGRLSIIKHNLYGRVYGCAVLTDNPKAALDLLDEKPEDSMFGNRDVYTNEYLTNFYEKLNCFFSLQKKSRKADGLGV